MFKLQRLEITGFKSFADHTEIVFTGDGITAVVGPNGCGKSNVADAIAWVLGEQRVKHLRGGEMKDVIFQGSRNRPPSGMAEVVLHLLRDETIEQEPDIDDIDSTLEGIDERHIEVEERLSPELLGEAAAPAEAPPDASAPVDATTSGEPFIEATGQTAEGIADTATPGSDAIATDGGAEVESETPVIESGPLAVDALQVVGVEVVAARPQHVKRHWRPTRRALEFAPGEVVTVTRRLYRSGESEYLLNNRACRLRDIQDLFSGTGLSGAHYAIVEQGRIGQILSAKPMDRRTLIEEAAGITKFRVRQRAAETRLESARSNLSRLSDIISEIDRQVNSLRRQAAKARRYRVLREELRELLRGLYVAEEHSLSSLLEDTRVRLEEISGEERALVEELATREEDARHATQDARAVEEELAGARAAVADAALRRDRQARELTYQEEQVVALLKRRSAIEAEMLNLRERLESVEQECESLKERDAALRDESEHSALVLQLAEAAYGQKLLEAGEAEAAIEGARAELLTHTAVAERLMEIGRQLEAALERLALQAEGLAHEGERAASIHAERIQDAEALNQEIAQARERLLKLIAEREAAVHTVVAGHEEVSETDAEAARIRDEFSRTRHRLDSLLELDSRRAHYSGAVQRIFSDEEAVTEFHFMGTLADMLNVEPEWERAVEGVFGSTLQAIIVPTPDDAARAAVWLREHNAGRAGFLVAGLHGASDEADAVITYRSAPANDGADVSGAAENFDNVRIGDLLGAPRELLAVLNRTLAQRMNARVAHSLDDAIAKSLATSEMYVTRDGDWVAGGQLVNAGDERALEEGAGLLGFRRELRELEARAAALSSELETAERTSAAARARLTELEDAVVLLNEVIGREERDAMARELNATQLTQEIERAERHLRVVADDAARLSQERLELEERRSIALTEAEMAEAARTSASVMVVEAATALALARRNAEVENESLGEQRAAAAAAAERRRATAAELRRMEAERSDLEARLERYERELEEVISRLEELQASIGEMSQGAIDVEAEQAREQQSLMELAARLAAAREQADALSDELAELNRRAAAARESRAGLEVQRAEATARLSYIREACLSELGQALEDLARERPLEEEFDLEAGRARVEELRARVEGFGAVNMMALEELGEAEERFEFLTGQRQDIVDGISSTEEALREIKRRSRERFRHAFEEINRNFSRFFLELFGGGRGEMSLIDADDVLESGIDIVAQPPGKRLQNVLLLSGGEKAMAALALVLGIFQYRPAPFCLLDEVDAPLDEANVGRFTDKVAEMSVSTQFIVITHNKRTMEMARALYGVTMEEPGISKLVSVKFE